jgi:alpha-tubulin suppressor-like RCC1 family protein
MRRVRGLTASLAIALTALTMGCPWLILAPVISEGGGGGGSPNGSVVASVRVSPTTATLPLRTSVQLTATARDANGGLIYGLPVTWVSDKTAVATVDTTGLVTAVAAGAAMIMARVEGKQSSASLSVVALVFTGVSAGDSHTCGLVTGGAVYCWGSNGSGELGLGTRTGPAQCSGVPVSFDCSTIPIAVTSSPSLTSLSAGGSHTCGITSAGPSYCWGNNVLGELGDSTSNDFRTSPVLVAGGFSFATLSAGGEHTCGITPAGGAYCWGGNIYNQLGDGTSMDRSSPVPVSGGLSFASVSAGFDHSCGVTTTGAAYCWGVNAGGDLGDSSSNGTAAPVAVAGGHSFAALSVGGSHTCGIATTGAMYCWGSNASGQLGDGTTTDRSFPVPVSGGLSFTAVTAGGAHTCAVTAGGPVYCWGNNTFGQLGDGMTASDSNPVAVSGGRSFSKLSTSAGGSHNCGVTTGGVAYCWGANGTGQLGDNSTNSSNVPVRVTGQP